MRKSHFNDWLLFLALENFRWGSARNEPKCIFPLKIWRFYYFIFEVVVCGAQVCVCYAVSQTGISFNVLRRRRRFFGLQRFLLNGETRTRSFGRLCSFGPSFCEEPLTGAGGEEELLHIWRRLLTGESWENTRLLRDSRCCFTKNVFGMNSCQLFMRLLCCCCCCSSDRFESSSSVVKVLSQLFVENLYSVCTGPWFVTATANFSSKNKDI